MKTTKPTLPVHARTRYTYNDAVAWYNRESRRARICGIDMNLAQEAADRFGVPRAEVLAALGWKE